MEGCSRKPWKPDSGIWAPSIEVPLLTSSKSLAFSGRQEKSHRIRTLPIQCSLLQGPGTTDTGQRTPALMSMCHLIWMTEIF